MSKSIILHVVVITFVALLSCIVQPNSLKKLEGKWTASGTIDEEHAWYLNYTFKGNSYSMEGYPPISESGICKIKEERGDSLLIEFKVLKSSPEYTDHSDWILLKGDRFEKNGMSFTKTKEEK